MFQHFSLDIGWFFTPFQFSHWLPDYFQRIFLFVYVIIDESFKPTPPPTPYLVDEPVLCL